MYLKKFLFLFLCLGFTNNSYAAEIDNNIVATIKPIASLVQNVMGDTGKPVLLLEGNSSPHDYQFKPSQIKSINNAKLVFFIDEHIEPFMSKVLANLSDDKKVRLSEKFDLLDFRSASDFEGHEHSHHSHDSVKDYHIWMSPKNAIVMVRTIEQSLSRTYPQNEVMYKQNADATIKKLQLLQSETLTELKDKKPYIVFHDAFQYFDKEFGLEPAGSISFDPTQSPSIKHTQEIKNKIEELKISCIFTEPQYNKKPILAITEGEDININELDELGAGLEPGQELYFQLIRKNISAYKKCFESKKGA